MVKPVVSVVNTVRARALNHRQFKSLLEDMEAEYEDVIHHNSVEVVEPGQSDKKSLGFAE